MRRTVLFSLMLALGAASAASAHEPRPAPVLSLSPAEPQEDAFAPLRSFEYRHPEFKDAQLVDRSEANRASIALGNEWRVETQGRSFHPGDGVKLRSEALYAAYALDGRTSFLVGGWRSKLSNGILPDFSVESFGIGIARKF